MIVIAGCASDDLQIRSERSADMFAPLLREHGR